MKLSIREQEFVKAFVKNGGNGTKAAIAAGYSPRTAGQCASRLLKREQVRYALERSAERASLSTAEALQNVARIANTAPQTKVSGAEVLKANELILKVNGALNEKATQSRITVNIGFLTSNQPSVEVTTEDSIDAESVAVVMPRQAQLPSSDE